MAEPADQFQPPEHIASEMCVVQHLDVERLGAALEELAKERVRLRLPRRVRLAFTGNANQSRVRVLT
jgi:hypothetical protein